MHWSPGGCINISILLPKTRMQRRPIEHQAAALFLVPLGPAREQIEASVVDVAQTFAAQVQLVLGRHVLQRRRRVRQPQERRSAVESQP